MGLTNTIITKTIYKCPKCGKDLYDYDNKLKRWQSKDTYNRCLCFTEGERITMIDGGLLFVAKGEPKYDDILKPWSAFTICNNCRQGIDADMVIKNGIFKGLTNLKNDRY